MLTVTIIVLLSMLIGCIFASVKAFDLFIVLADERKSAQAERDKALKEVDSLKKQIEKSNRQAAQQLNQDKFYILNKKAPIDADVLLTQLQETYYEHGAIGTYNTVQLLNEVLGDGYGQYTSLPDARLAAWVSTDMPKSLQRLQNDLTKIYQGAYDVQ